MLCEELGEGLDQSTGSVDLYGIKIPLRVPINGLTRSIHEVCQQGVPIF